MKTLTHSQARQWIEQGADGLLNPSQQATLQQHLKGCTECKAYAAELAALEKALGQTLKAHLGTGQLSKSATDKLARNVKSSMGNKGGSAMKSKFKLGPMALGALGVLVLLGLAFAFISFQNFGNMINEGGRAPLSIFIQNPQQGSQFEVGSTIGVQVKASGPAPVLS